MAKGESCIAKTRKWTIFRLFLNHLTMKTHIFKCSPISVYTIVISIMTLFVFSSCESNDLQLKSQADTETPILPRTITDCEDCPDVHCCCAVELLNGTEAELLFCGVYTAMSGTLCGPFTPPSPCGTVSGTSSIIDLGNGNPTRVLFCLGTGGSFRLQYLGVDAVSIRISCQYDEVTPDWEYIDLDEDDVLYYDSNSGCFLVECS